ncbi:SpoIIE family protein phosphatase [Streptomyces gilvus]|uniref:SpoIIE family protein phosphatase n=1 Tax=Streptomyces gilvus TaxID=2920937 RepID=UPI001F0F034E|nr:SpoIIE family protein phosphatase [Streptomyces sp. CME 23]MCH5675592.1 SpoIIE family protein phosphatase [Streptomyces sp. CME 23]
MTQSDFVQRGMMNGNAATGQNEAGGAGPEGLDTAFAIMDVRGVFTACSPAAARMLGYAANEIIGHGATDLLAGRLPEEVLRHMADGVAWHAAVPVRHREGQILATQVRACPLHGDGDLQWLLMFHAQGEFTGQGEVQAASGRPTVDQAFDQSTVLQALWDADARYVALNQVAAGVMHVDKERVLGRTLDDLDETAPSLEEEIPGFEASAYMRSLRQVIETGNPVLWEHYLTPPGELRPRGWSVSMWPVKDATGRVLGAAAATFDSTEQQRAQQRLALLNEAGSVIGSTLDVPRTADELAEMIVPRLADFASVNLLEPVLHGEEPVPYPAGHPVITRRIAHRSALEGCPETAVELGAIDTYPESSPPAECLETGRTILSSAGDPSMHRWMELDPNRAALASRFGFHSILAVPLRARGITLGVAVLIRHRNRVPFDPDDLILAEELASRAAICVDNARRYSHERAAALALQQSLLPQHLPEQSAVEVESRYIPAGSRSGIGGDWFDVIPLSGARVALIVGDVVGHGLHASATMGRLRTAVRTLADTDLPADELLTYLDDLVIRLSAEADRTGSDGEVGATCLIAVYDPISRHCALARAGHPPPALVLPDGTVTLLDLPAAPPLGLGGLPFESAHVELPEGALLVLYTDGLVESRDRDVDAGLDELRSVLRQPAASLEALCDSVFNRLLPDRPVADDVALLVARTQVFDADQIATWELRADPSVVAGARTQATSCLEAWGLEELSFAVELVVSELVTNAVRYGGAPIRLRLIRDRTIICEVSDGNSTAPHLRRARVYDEGGRGLLLVAQLTQRWGTRHEQTGKTIWAEWALPSISRVSPWGTATATTCPKATASPYAEAAL